MDNVEHKGVTWVCEHREVSSALAPVFELEDPPNLTSTMVLGKEYGQCDCKISQLVDNNGIYQWLYTILYNVDGIGLKIQRSNSWDIWGLTGEEKWWFSISWDFFFLKDFYKLVLISTVCAITSICSFYFWFISINRPPKYKKCVRQGEEGCCVLCSQLIGSHPMHRILKRSIKVAVLSEYEQVDRRKEDC